MLDKLGLLGLPTGTEIIFNFDSESYVYKTPKEKYWSKRTMKNRDELNELYASFLECYKTKELIYSEKKKQYIVK